MNNNLFKILLFSSVLSFINCSGNKKINSTDDKESSKKINGVNLVALNSPTRLDNFTQLNNINANYVALVPFGFITSNSSTVQYNSKNQWYGERIEGITESIKQAKCKGLKIMIKPHLWIWDKWVGDLNFTNEDDWLEFENSYSRYILDFAKLSDSLQVELFCIGVELKQVVINRPDFWIKLIEKVKNVYSGKITYAANWDNYQNVHFWNKIDYIGIDAYFPISNEKTPSLESCISGWQNDYTKIEFLSKSLNKNVIFTEFGYRNVDFTGKEPWSDIQLSTFNTKAQLNAYQAIFNKFWNKHWFEGGFLWKWHPEHKNAGGLKNNRFTPQNKPIENLIKTIYSQTK